MALTSISGAVVPSLSLFYHGMIPFQQFVKLPQKVSTSTTISVQYLILQPTKPLERGQKDKGEAKSEDHCPDLTDNTNESEVKPRRHTKSKRSAATQEGPVPKRRKRRSFTSPLFPNDSAEEEPQNLFILDGSIVEDRIKESFSDRGRPRLQ